MLGREIIVADVLRVFRFLGSSQISLLKHFSCLILFSLNFRLNLYGINTWNKCREKIYLYLDYNFLPSFSKFWTRNRPGDEMRDRYNLNNLPAGVEQELLEYSKWF